MIVRSNLLRANIKFNFKTIEKDTIKDTIKIHTIKNLTERKTGIRSISNKRKYKTTH